MLPPVTANVSAPERMAPGKTVFCSVPWFFYLPPPGCAEHMAQLKEVFQVPGSSCFRLPCCSALAREGSRMWPSRQDCCERESRVSTLQHCCVCRARRQSGARFAALVMHVKLAVARSIKWKSEIHQAALLTLDLGVTCWGDRGWEAWWQACSPVP